MAIKSSGKTVVHYKTRLANEKEQLNSILKNNRNFNPTKVVCSGEGDYDFCTFYVGADDVNDKIYCFSGTSGLFFSYEDIVIAEIIVDGKVTETKKSASLGGTIVGGVVAGSIGAVIGGTNMATATSAEHVSIIKVHVLLRNSSANSFDIVCYDGGGAIKTTSPLYKYAYANAQNAFDILRVAIDKVQMENTKSSKIEMSAPKSNIQELKELAVLKQQGLITDEEFAAMKAKVINKDVTNM